MTMAALRIVPPSPPAPEQRCFGFVRIAIVVHEARTRKTKCEAPPPKPKRASESLLDWRPRPPIRAKALRPFVTRKTMAEQRPQSMRSPTLSVAERAEMERGIADLIATGDYLPRPRTLADCPTGPCPFISCRAHLKYDVDHVTGRIKDMFPGRDWDEMAETCAHRVAASTMASIDAGAEPLPLEQVGGFLNLTMERARQIEVDALRNLRRAVARLPKAGEAVIEYDLGRMSRAESERMRDAVADYVGVVDAEIREAPNGRTLAVKTGPGFAEKRGLFIDIRAAEWRDAE